MGVYIKGEKMPESCDKCWQMKICDRWTAELAQDGSGAWMPTYPKPASCPLVEVPEPHGDLIDNEDVGEVLETLEKYEDVDKDTLKVVGSMLWKIPTVIEAEGE